MNAEKILFLREQISRFDHKLVPVSIDLSREAYEREKLHSRLARLEKLHGLEIREGREIEELQKRFDLVANAAIQAIEGPKKEKAALSPELDPVEAADKPKRGRPRSKK